MKGGLACVLFEKMDPSFFTILVSKNRDIYVDLLLQIHDCIYRNQTMSMERALLQDLLEDYVQDKKYEIDFQEEAEYSDIENELRSEKDVYDRDIQFLLRLFEEAYLDQCRSAYGYDEKNGVSALSQPGVHLLRE